MHFFVVSDQTLLHPFPVFATPRYATPTHPIPLFCSSYIVECFALCCVGWQAFSCSVFVTCVDLFLCCVSEYCLALLSKLNVIFNIIILFLWRYDQCFLILLFSSYITDGFFQFFFIVFPFLTYIHYIYYFPHYMSDFTLGKCISNNALCMKMGI